MKKMIEGKFRADAKARQAEAGSGNLPNNKTRASSDHMIGTKGEAREKIAKAIGIGSSASMERAERVVENGIPELVDAMDSGELDERGRDPRPLEEDPRRRGRNHGSCEKGRTNPLNSRECRSGTHI